jgi:ABC-type uncharacterized transport system substrate-binding protein
VHKQIAPGIRRVAIIQNPDIAVNVAFLRAAEAPATSLNVVVTSAGARSSTDIERAVTTFALQPGGGLIVMPNPTTTTPRDQIISSAARLDLPAIYPYTYYPRRGGLASYGFDQIDQWKGAASYVDRILRGIKPSERPVQLPSKYQLVINLKTAKDLGLNIPDKLLFTADEVIE